MNRNRNANKPYSILVGVDFSDLGELALLEAESLAQLRRPCHLHVVHVVQYIPSSEQSDIALELATADSEKTDGRDSNLLRTYVKKVLSQREESESDVAESAIPNLTTHTQLGSPAEAIAQLATDLEVDLVIVGTHGHRGITRLLLGSVAEGVVRTAPCPVLVVRPTGTTSVEELAQT